MSGIAIYAEGGGMNAAQKAELRLGFDGLLSNLKSRAREKKLGWRVIPSGTRGATYDAFINAVITEPQTTNVLLVDSEAQVAPCDANVDKDAALRVSHLRQRDGWDLSASNPQRVHLMAQCMEAWIVADPAALQKYYGQKFLPKVLPVRPNLEEEPKRDVCDKFATATRETTKGPYRKIAHASKLLQEIDPHKVEKRCPRFAKLTHWLNDVIDDLLT